MFYWVTNIDWHSHFSVSSPRQCMSLRVRRGPIFLQWRSRWRSRRSWWSSPGSWSSWRRRSIRAWLRLGDNLVLTELQCHQCVSPSRSFLYPSHLVPSLSRGFKDNALQCQYFSWRGIFLHSNTNEFVNPVSALLVAKEDVHSQFSLMTANNNNNFPYFLQKDFKIVFPKSTIKCWICLFLFCKISSLFITLKIQTH